MARLSNGKDVVLRKINGSNNYKDFLVYFHARYEHQVLHNGTKAYKGGVGDASKVQGVIGSIGSMGIEFMCGEWFFRAGANCPPLDSESRTNVRTAQCIDAHQTLDFQASYIAI